MPRFLQSTPISLSSPAAPEAVSVDSDVVVILAALLCALICVVGLALVARCAWIRRASASPSSAPQPCPKGLKKKTIRSLPKFIFDSSSSSSCSSTKTNIDCAICLAEFCQGDELRVLPQCGHRFHVCCIDTWLAAHSSCPSCRQPLLVTMCDKCGASSASASASASAAGGGDQEPKPREDGDANRFLP